MIAPHLLIVEDDESIRTWLEFELSQEEYVIRSAQDGIEGMTMLRQGARPDLILLDVNLPGMNGFEMCRQIKANHLTAAVPVLFLTARAATDDLLIGLDAGGVEYITKPFKMTELKARVKALLRQSAQERNHHQTAVAAEIEQAADLQASLMKYGMIDVPGLEIFVDSQAAKQVGGDFVHFGRKSDGRYCVAEGDVSGKGMAAALLTTAVRAEMRTSTRESASPAEAMSAINQHLYDDLTEINRFITAFLGIFDPGAGELTYSNAGHSLIAYKRAEQPIQILEADSPPLGVLPHYSGANHTLRLGPGDVVLMATDGMYEAINADGEQYGIERLLRMCERWVDRSAADLGSNLLADVNHFCNGITPTDDCTLIILKGKEAS